MTRSHLGVHHVDSLVHNWDDTSVGATEIRPFLYAQSDAPAIRCFDAGQGR